MLNILFEPGTRICWQNRTGTVYPAGPKCMSVVLDEGKPVVVSKSDMLAAVAEHQLHVIDQMAISPRPIQQHLVNSKYHLRKAAYINAARKHPKYKNEKIITAAIRETAPKVGDIFGVTSPAWTTVYNWITELEAMGKSADPLRTEQPTKKRRRDKRISESINNMMMDALDDSFMQPLGTSIADAYSLFLRRYRELYGVGDREEPYKKSFYRRSKELCPIQVVEKRLGRSEAKKLARITRKSMNAENLMDMVTIDAIHINMPLYDEDGVEIGYPVVQFMLEIRSRSCIGFEVEINSESAAGAVACLQNSVRKKQHEIDHPYTQNDWIMFGKMLRVGSDGGSGYISQVFNLALAVMYIERQANEANSPWLNAINERFNRTVRDNFLVYFPSYLGKRESGRNIKELKKFGEKVTLKQFKEYLTKYIVDDYNQAPHSALLGETPHNVWLRESQIKPPVEPNGLGYVMKLRGLWMERQYAPHTGIRINNVFYSEDYDENQLNRHYFDQLRDTSQEKLRVDVLYNPMDISAITVMVNDKLIVLPAFKSDFPVYKGMSLAEHRSGRESRKRVNREQNQIENRRVLFSETKREENQEYQISSQRRSKRPQMNAQSAARQMAAGDIAMQSVCNVESPYSDDEFESYETDIPNESIDALDRALIQARIPQ